MGAWGGGDAVKSRLPGEEEPLRKELVRAIRDAASNDSRTLQRPVGPSELGGPCDRRLAMRMCGVPAVNRTSDPWPATVGTAIHAWLKPAMDRQNQILGYPRWVTECPVEADPALGGTSDLFDRDSGTVVDWKTCGVEPFKRLKVATDPPEGYMIQIQIYGLGWARAGYQVKSVALAMLPRAGLLRDMVFFQRPYDPSVAQQALARLYGVQAGITNLRQILGREDVWDQIPPTEDHCGWCSYFRTGATEVSSQGCPGV